MPRPKRKQRRVNPHKAPWDKYPILVFTPDEEATAAREAEHRQLRTADALFNRDTTPLGTLTVTRGEYDTDQLDPSWLHTMAIRPGVEHLITTDGTGRHDILPAGVLIDADQADTDPLDTGYPTGVDAPQLNRDAPGATLTSWAAQLRSLAQQYLEVADEYDQLAADGWELVPTACDANEPPRLTVTAHRVVMVLKVSRVATSAHPGCRAVGRGGRGVRSGARCLRPSLASGPWSSRESRARCDASGSPVPSHPRSSGAAG